MRLLASILMSVSLSFAATVRAEDGQPDRAPRAHVAHARVVPLGEDVDEEEGMERRSPGALWSGLGLTAVGGANLLVGFAGLISGGCDLECHSLIPIEVAAPMMIGGAAMMVLGVPLMIYGKKLVPETNRATLQVAPGAARVRWRF
jgi:hypothetical protein